MIELPIPQQAEPEPQLVATYRLRLRDADRLSSPEGQLVIVLAERLVAAGNTGASVASLARELRSAYEQAMRGARSEPDALDELAERRRRRAGG